MTLRARIGDAIRPTRRRFNPRRFKESYVNDVLAMQSAAIYLEIGVREGGSFRLARAQARIGVDPKPGPNIYPLAAGEQLFESTSDEFFAREAKQVLAPGSVTVALIDGLHEFEQVVRDLHNLEPYMAPKGLVVLDDMNPKTADRAREQPTGRSWNGDVWKLGPYLQAERPDLEFVTVDAAEGLGLVTSFGGPAPEISLATLQVYKKLTYADLARDRRNMLRLVGPDKVQHLLPSLR